MLDSSTQLFTKIYANYPMYTRQTDIAVVKVASTFEHLNIIPTTK